jgi:hypothetical protein
MAKLIIARREYFFLPDSPRWPEFCIGSYLYQTDEARAMTWRTADNPRFFFAASFFANAHHSTIRIFSMDSLKGTRSRLDEPAAHYAEGKLR